LGYGGESVSGNDKRLGKRGGTVGMQGPFMTTKD